MLIYHVRDSYHTHETSIRDQYSTSDHQAKKPTAQESSPPYRFNDKGVGAQNRGTSRTFPPGANPFPALKTGCRLRTPSFRKKLEALKDTKRTQQCLRHLDLIEHEGFPLPKLWPTDFSISWSGSRETIENKGQDCNKKCETTRCAARDYSVCY